MKPTGRTLLNVDLFCSLEEIVELKRVGLSKCIFTDTNGRYDIESSVLEIYDKLILGKKYFLQFYNFKNKKVVVDILESNYE